MTWVLQLDHTIFHWINTGWSNVVFDLMMPWITHLGDQKIVWLWIAGIGILAGWQFARKTNANLRNRRQLIAVVRTGLLFVWYASVIYGINGGLIVGFKHWFSRPRPYVQQKVVLRASPDDVAELRDYGSFFSGHTCSAFIVATLLAYRLRRKRWVFSFYSLATLVGLSRIYLGVHFPGDVIVGACVGLGITWLMLVVFRITERRNNGREDTHSAIKPSTSGRAGST
jgi:undecaprenyl-diphosphatase